MENPEEQTVETTKVETTDPAILEKAEKFERLEKEAAQAGFNTVDDYYDFLADNKFREVEEKPESPPKEKPVTTPAPQNNEAAERANRLATQSYLQSQHTAYQYAQGAKPEGQRSTYSRKTLQDAIMDSRTSAVIANLAEHEAFDGNLFAAADFHLKQIEQLKKPTPEEAENDAKLKAAQDAGVLPKGQPPPVEKTGEVDPNDAAADDIIADDPVYVAQN